MEKDLSVIIPMAGEGRRFREAGYACPKYRIEAREKSLFEWSLESLRGYAPRAKQYIFVTRKEERAEGFIRERCERCGIARPVVVELDQPTEGQAATCLYALPHCRPEEPILIYNIDTYVEPFAMRAKDLVGAGHIPCFLGEGDHWSFVRADARGRVVRVREKERISPCCSLGAYYVSSAELYRIAFRGYYGGGRPGGADGDHERGG